MADLTENTPRQFHGDAPAGSIVDMPIGQFLHIYAGMALARSAGGYVEPAAAGAGNSGDFRGFAVAERDATLVGGGLYEVAVQTHGHVWLRVAKGSAYAATDVDSTVYCTDSDTFTLAAATGDNPIIGKIVKVHPSDIGADNARCLVAFKAANLPD